MTQKQTEGPWFLDQYGHVYGWTEEDKEGRKESVILLDNCHSEATFADKRLIMHAPELLEALKMVSNFNWKNNRTHLLEIVNAAIAKATGA